MQVRDNVRIVNAGNIERVRPKRASAGRERKNSKVTKTQTNKAVMRTAKRICKEGMKVVPINATTAMVVNIPVRKSR